MSTYEDIVYERLDGYAVVTLNRPDRLNALSIATVGELDAVLEEIASDHDIHVVILRGAGRAFCAGIDMTQGFDAGPESGTTDQTQARYAVQKAYSQLVIRMREIPQPLIAAVHGYACGGGLSLAAACDIKLVAPSAKLNVAFITVGLTGGDMGTSFALPRMVSSSIAAELLYTGRFMDADEAVKTGFASRVVPEDELLEAASDLARSIAQHNPLGIRLTKEMLNRSLDGASLRTMVDMENRSQVLSATTGAFDEVVKRFAKKPTEPRLGDDNAAPE